ncbi:MAG: hypothetical protein D6761_04835 [Candidatus Dadabacteria bacterium]|nr:MAG: hypothetical protein D6761_04835 [Candidatus Dadabacteria bacterium]
MFLKRFVMLSSIALLSGGMACGLVDDALNNLAAQLEEEAASAGIDVNATIPDQQQAEEIFGATVNAIMGSAMEVAMQAAQESAGGAAPMQDAQTITVNKTIDVEGGGTLTVDGTVTQEQTETSITMTQDITVTWSGVNVPTENGAVETSGKLVQVTTLEIDPQAQSPEPSSVESDLVGQITTPAGAFAFDVHISLASNTLTIEGTLNGKDYSQTIDLSQLEDDMGGAPDGTTDTVTGPTDGVTDSSLPGTTTP